MTPRLGLVARNDSGGLGIQTWELARHLHPQSVLLIDLGADSRGHADPDRYSPASRVIVNHGNAVPPDVVDEFLDRVDVLFTVECDYAAGRLLARALERGIRCVVQGNPELWVDMPAGVECWLPTDWEAHRIPGASVVPVPVALDRYPSLTMIDHVGPPVFAHQCAPAMADRAGTLLLLQALPHVETECTVIMESVGSLHAIPDRIGNARLIQQGAVRDYWDVHPPHARALIAPRRYGGLSLPVQEAAAMGIPAIVLDTDPYAGSPAAPWVVEASGSKPCRMKGGQFRVNACHPTALAATIDTVARRASVSWEALVARSWASDRAWAELAPVYRERLGINQREKENESDA